MYKKYLKRLLDIIISLIGIIIIAIPMLLIATSILINDPGPILFKQKRVGKKKDGKITYFNILKFRTMRVDTPHDVPTHLLDNPEQYITEVGRFLRLTSLDELPQIIQIFTGKMSVLGPRPALWNQYDLIAERDKYGANDITPGLSGWAQINGRDSVEVIEKAKFDGEYVSNLTFAMDWKCFWGTIINVLRRTDVVEGSAGKTKEHEEETRSMD